MPKLHRFDLLSTFCELVANLFYNKLYANPQLIELKADWSLSFNIDDQNVFEIAPSTLVQTKTLSLSAAL